MRDAIFPMRHLNITQKYGVGTHKYGYPIDNAGKDTGINGAWAPFDGVIKKIYPVGNSVWLESTSKVRYADGTEDYAVVMFTHDNYVGDLRVGQKVKYGQTFYHEGTAGYATGNHVHIECGKGKFTGTGWHQDKRNGQWIINNPYPPEKMLLLKDVTVINGGGLKWKKYQAPKPTPKPAPEPAPAPQDYAKENSALLKENNRLLNELITLVKQIFDKLTSIFK